MRGPDLFTFFFAVFDFWSPGGKTGVDLFTLTVHKLLVKTSDSDQYYCPSNDF